MAPNGASIVVRRESDERVAATVTAVVRPFGSGLPGVTVRETAVAAIEPTGTAPPAAAKTGAVAHVPVRAPPVTRR
jgi:hypothetical protein